MELRAMRFHPSGQIVGFLTRMLRKDFPDGPRRRHKGLQGEPHKQPSGDRQQAPGSLEQGALVGTCGVPQAGHLGCVL